jgi:hypothetical protein
MIIILQPLFELKRMILSYLSYVFCHLIYASKSHMESNSESERFAAYWNPSSLYHIPSDDGNESFELNDSNVMHQVSLKNRKQAQRFNLGLSDCSVNKKKNKKNKNKKKVSSEEFKVDIPIKKKSKKPSPKKESKKKNKKIGKK